MTGRTKKLSTLHVGACLGVVAAFAITGATHAGGGVTLQPVQDVYRGFGFTEIYADLQ